MTAIVLALLLSQARDATPARVTSAGTAMLGGVLTTSAGGVKQPLRRALITVSGTGIAGVRQLVSDDSGRFLIDGLAAGRYTLIVDKPGYLRTHYGSTRPGRPPGAPIALIDGQRWLDLAIDVPRGGVIDGTVRDQNGAPLASAQVSARLVTFVGGDRRLVNAGGSGPSYASTDDRGHYRLFGLPPGEYVVRTTSGAMQVPVLSSEEIKAAETQLQTGRVAPPDVTPRVQVGAFFPGVADENAAETITLGLGEERDGADIVSAPVPTFNLEFNAIGPSGRPVTSASIGMAVITTRSLFTSPGGVLLDSTGKGRVTALTSARYLLFGSARESEDANAPLLFASAEIDVNGANASGVMQFLPGARVSGGLRAVSGSLPPLGAGARVQLNPAPVISGTQRGPVTAAVSADGTFMFTNVPPGRYRIEVGGVAGWNAMSATYQNTDTLDYPLEVGLGADVDGLSVGITNALTEISGIVTDRAGRPSPEFAVVVFSAERDLWSSPRRSSGIVRIGTDGRYRVIALPPGAYYLAVVNDIDASQVNDPMFLEQLIGGAVSLRLTDGEKIVQDLKIGG